MLLIDNESYQFNKESFNKLSSVIDTYNRKCESYELNDHFIRFNFIFFYYFFFLNYIKLIDFLMFEANYTENQFANIFV